MSRIKKQVETYFKKSLALVIAEDHWRDKKSVLALTKDCGVIRQSFMHLCKVEGLKLRGSRAAALARDIRGEKHWAWGKTKTDCEAYRLASLRLTRRNPMHDKAAAARAAKSRALIFRKKPWPQETAFRKILDGGRVEYVFQYPIARFVIDFYIPALKLCIEIDSTSKWCSRKRRSARVKDALLRTAGYEILRIDKARLLDSDFIRDVLAANNVILKS